MDEMNNTVPFHTIEVHDSNTNTILVLCRLYNGELDIACAELITNNFEINLCDDELDTVKHQFKDELIEKLKQVT